jgi:hypothetical protein
MPFFRKGKIDQHQFSRSVSKWSKKKGPPKWASFRFNFSVKITEQEQLQQEQLQKEQLQQEQLQLERLL